MYFNFCLVLCSILNLISAMTPAPFNLTTMVNKDINETLVCYIYVMGVVLTDNEGNRGLALMSKNYLYSPAYVFGPEYKRETANLSHMIDYLTTSDNHNFDPNHDYCADATELQEERVVKAKRLRELINRSGVDSTLELPNTPYERYRFFNESTGEPIRAIPGLKFCKQ